MSQKETIEVNCFDITFFSALFMITKEVYAEMKCDDGGVLVFDGRCPLRSLVTSVLGHFGLFLKVRSDQGPN